MLEEEESGLRRMEEEQQSEAGEEERIEEEMGWRLIKPQGWHKREEQEVGCRNHWKMYYYLFGLLDEKTRVWDLRNLRDMEINPVIGRSLATTMCEIGWQESDAIGEHELLGVKYEHDNLEEVLQLWWQSHVWTRPTGGEGAKRDLQGVHLNVGPVGFWGSTPAIEDVMSQRPGFATFQDLRVGQQGLAAVKGKMGGMFPDYHCIISTHSRKQWVEGRKRNYAFSCMILLHKNLYANVKGVTVFQGKSKKEGDLINGRVLAVRATDRVNKEEVGVVTVYQHTADRGEEQRFVWEKMEAFLNTETSSRVYLTWVRFHPPPS